MPDFAFVVSDGTAQRPSAAVRSHAVKSGLQRKSQTGDASGPKASQLTVRQKDSLKGRFKLSDMTSKPKKTTKAGAKEQSSKSKNVGFVRTKATMARDSVALSESVMLSAGYDSSSLPSAQLQLVKSPSQGSSDPFNTFPVPLTNDIEKLAKFFVSRFNLPVPIAAIQKQWWDYALSDSLVMHSTLGLAAATWSMLVPSAKRIVHEGYRQKGLALRGVQEGIDKGNNAISLVATIASLANIEGVEGNFTAARVHLQGLDLLVRSWVGGYDNIKSNINVARTVNWSDIQAANGLGVRPLVATIMPLESVSLPLSVLTAAEEPSLSHLNAFEKTPDDATMRFCFSLVRQGQYSLESQDVPRYDFRIIINAVDHFLADALGGDTLLDLGRMLLTAAQVAYYAIVRGVPPTGLLPRIMVRRLRQQLDAGIRIFGSRPEHQHGLIWCLVIGSAAAYETAEDWDTFSKDLSTAIKAANIRGPLELGTIAKRFIWHQKFPGIFLENHGPSLFYSASNS
ncbi:hypothetical protein B0J13DRAFT_33969 [Dactylonectria estremocensis]|uniref:Tachykinin family protein n=1 Tax=Dactylonectria estremocensis TaxID=1079267 RepID=A0A9P9JJ42_9HYPO|nr:hypothetical protein B0J13DRAFT_33969 [Dactylonectria estremocensis]